jgi:hypothetical protein
MFQSHPFATFPSGYYTRVDFSLRYTIILWRQRKPDVKVITLLAHPGEKEDEEALRVTRKRSQSKLPVAWCRRIDVSDFGEFSK